MYTYYYSNTVNFSRKYYFRALAGISDFVSLYIYFEIEFI